MATQHNLTASLEGLIWHSVHGRIMQFFSNLSLHTKIWAGSFLVFCCLLAVSVNLYQHIQDSQRQNEWVDHTHFVVNQADELLLELVNMQTGYRGFLLSGDETFLAPYTSGHENYSRLLQSLQSLVKDNPPQTTRLRELDDEVQDWLTTFIQSGIATRRSMSQDITTAQLAATIQVEAGKRQFDELRVRIAEIRAVETELLRQRTVQSRQAGQRLFIILTGGTVASIFLSLVVALVVARGIARRVSMVAQAATNLAQGQLYDLGPLPEGRDEVGQLATAFTHMATTIRTHLLAQQQADEQIQRINDELKIHLADSQQHTRELTLLSELSDLLQACLTPFEAFAVLQKTLPTLFPSESGMVFLLRDAKNIVECVASWGTAASHHSFDPTYCWALRRGRPHLMDQADNRLSCAHHANGEGTSICIPMLARGTAVGVFHVTNQTLSAFTASQQRLAGAVASQLELALANIQLQDTLRQQATRDPLTGLFNRRALNESLERELRRAARRRSSIGVIMLDLDHFKHVNDTFGHAAGDALLQELARCLQREIRTEDFACRYGGEEFALILPDASLENTQRRAEDIRAAVAGLKVHYEEYLVDRLTCSLGVAAFPNHGASGEAVLQAADTALYEAKRTGRDRVVVGSVDHELMTIDG